MTPDERVTDTGPPPPASESPLGDYRHLAGKIRRARLRRDRMGRWMKWGMLVGIVGWLLFQGIMWVVIRATVSGPAREARLEAMVLLLWLTPFAGLALSAVGGVSAALVDLVRPIYLALFDSNRFEREYGTPPSGRSS